MIYLKTTGKDVIDLRVAPDNPNSPAADFFPEALGKVFILKQRISRENYIQALKFINEELYNQRVKEHGEIPSYHQFFEYEEEKL